MYKLAARFNASYRFILFVVCLSAWGGGSALAQSAGGSLALASASYTVSQSAGSVSVSVTRTGGSTGAVSVAVSTLHDTAAVGVDYAGKNQVLTWASGDTAAKTFTVTIYNSSFFVGTKNFFVNLSSPTGASLGAQASATVSIQGNSASSTIALSTSSDAVSQSAGSVSVSVTRTGSSAGTASVAVSTLHDTAAVGVDYVGKQQVLTWASGDTAAKTFTVTINSSAPFAGSKSFFVQLNSATGASLGSLTTATVSIQGGLASGPGQLALSAPAYSLAQNANALVVTVGRTQGSNGAVSVNYATADGTAAAGTDYTATAGSLQWAANDTSVKTFPVPISNTTPFSGSKTFNVALTGPAGGATVGAPSTATATINGVNPAAPAISSLSPTGATAGGAAFTLTVNGSNFISTSVVEWNGTALPTTYVSAAKLTAQVSAGWIAAVGTASVTVVSPPGGGISNAVTFTISSVMVGCGTPSPQTGIFNLTTTDGSISRLFLLQVPADYSNTKAYALTFVFHGLNGNSSVSSSWGLQNSPGAAESSIFVFPNSNGSGWDDSHGGHDMIYFDNMVKQVEATYCIDSKRVFAAGFSWGGDFVTALTVTRGNVLRAAAVNSATIEFGNYSDYRTHIDYAYQTATHPAVRFEHAIGGDSYYPAPLFATTSTLFQHLNSCSSTSTPYPSTTSSMTCESYNSCTNEVIECPFNANLGHTLPPNWATDTWSFFASFP